MLGIHVYEYPFKPGYFNVNRTLAILGKTQYYVEIGRKEICYTLQDLEDLDYKHRFDLVSGAVWSSFRIVLSGASDVITIFSWGAAAGAKSFLTTFIKGIMPSTNIPTLNAVVGTTESIVTGEISVNDAGDWGAWFLGYAIPFIGTYSLTDVKPTIYRS